ncbi:hypothetical protein Tco_0596469 [Tanacetum coccineum]
MLFVLLLVLGIDQNIVNKRRYEVVQKRQSSRCLLLEPSIGDNLILGRSLSRHSTLEVDRISHQFAVADNGSSPLIRNSFISDGAIDKVLGYNSAAPGTGAIDLWKNSTCMLCGRQASSLENTSGKIFDDRIKFKWKQTVVIGETYPVTTLVSGFCSPTTSHCISPGYSVAICLVLVLLLGAVLFEVAWSPTLKANDGIVVVVVSLQVASSAPTRPLARWPSFLQLLLVGIQGLV